MLIKRILATVSACAVLAGSTFIVDADNEHIKSGMCGENVRWSFDTTTGIITISGTGDMYTNYYKWGYNRYSNDIKEVVIEEGITSIGEKAFAKTSLSGDLVLPKTLNYIANEAFIYTNITSVKLNEGMHLGGQSFKSCNSLKEVTIPKDIDFLPTPASNAMRENAAFFYCESLEKVIIKGGGLVGAYDKIENGIGGHLFNLCTSLKEIIIDCDNIEYVDPVVWLTDEQQQSGTFWIENNPTFYIYKDSTTEKTLKNAGYFKNASVQYIADFSALETAISEAEDIDTSKYTDESVSAFNDVLKNGKAILEDLTSTQDEVDSAVKAIEDAKNALEEKKEPSSNPSDSSSNPSDSSSNPSDSSNPSGSSNNSSDSSNPSGSGQSEPSNSGSSQPTSAQPVTNAPTTAAPKVTPPTTTKVVKPAKVKAVKLKAKKKKLKVSWRKVSGATGYEVKVATNRKFTKGKKTVTVKKNKVTLKNLKSKKKYFVKVRAYKLANGRKYYGKWSKVGKRKTK